MLIRRSLLVVCVVALAHAALYIVYQAPDREAMVKGQMLWPGDVPGPVAGVAPGTRFTSAW